MHTKIAINSVACRRNRKFIDSVATAAKKLSISEDRLDEALRTSESNSFFDDSWVEEEATKRDHPLVNQLCDLIKQFLQDNNSGILLSYCPELPLRISEEIARISRDEPGGLAACRFQLNIALDECFSTFAESLNLNYESKPSSLTLGNTSLSKTGMIETFEVKVYLFPSNSVLSKLQTIITSLRQKDNLKFTRSKNISLLPDFVLTKQKLFRSNSNKPFVVVKSIAK